MIWRAARLLPVGGPPVEDGAVACRDGRIVSCGPADAVLAAHPGAPVRDLGDCILLPGLVDAHCHLEWSLMDGLLPSATFAQWLRGFIALRDRMTADDYGTSARYAALRALQAGTTTLADSGPTGAGAAALRATGIAGLVHLEAFGRETGADADAAAARMAERIAALDGEAGDLVTAGLSPHAPYSVGPGLWRALRDHPGLAARPWATHVAESPDELEVVLRGGGPLAEVFASLGWRPPPAWPGDGGVVARMARGGALGPGTVAAHCVLVPLEEMPLLADAGVTMAHCPESNARLLCGRAPIEALAAAGVRVGLGTDSPASAGVYDLRAEARACAREAAAAGVTPPDAPALLRLATLGSAEALGLDHEIGSIAPGKRCDLVAVLPGVPADDPAAAVLHPASRVDTVVVAGEEVLRGGIAAHVDTEAVETAWRAARRRIAMVPG